MTSMSCFLLIWRKWKRKSEAGNLFKRSMKKAPIKLRENKIKNRRNSDTFF